MLNHRYFQLLVTFLVLIGCRSTGESRSDVADLNTEKPWYDQAGTVQSCDNLPSSCPLYPDPKGFIDTCVSRGFQAKSCGCLILCSAKLSGFGLVDNVKSVAGQATAGESCKAADEGTLAKIVKMRQPGGSLDRCLNSHVCNGNLGWCAADDRAASTKIRDLAKHGCAHSVWNTVCPNGYQDTLNCSEAAISSLSQVWSEMRHQDSTMKRCIRSLVCGEVKSDCSPNNAKRALEIKRVLNQSGCEYWLGSFCAIGSQAW